MMLRKAFLKYFCTGQILPGDDGAGNLQELIERDPEELKRIYRENREEIIHFWGMLRRPDQDPVPMFARTRPRQFFGHSGFRT